jgi:hypothetical protein
MSRDCFTYMTLLVTSGHTLLWYVTMDMANCVSLVLTPECIGGSLQTADSIETTGQVS